MPLGARVASGIVRHPAGHFGQGCRRGEQRRIAGSVIGAEEPRRHVGLEVPDYAGVQMATARLKIGRAERPHGDGVRVVDQHVSDGALRWQRRSHRDLRVSPDVLNATAGRELEPEQMTWDLQDARPVSEGVEITDRRAVLDPADLRLGEPKPGAKQFLGHTAAPVARREFAMPTIRAGNPADVLSGERVPERWSTPEGW